MNMLSAIHVLSGGFYFILVMQDATWKHRSKVQGHSVLSVRVSWPRQIAAAGHNIQYAAGCWVEDDEKANKKTEATHPKRTVVPQKQELDRSTHNVVGTKAGSAYFRNKTADHTRDLIRLVIEYMRPRL